MPGQFLSPVLNEAANQFAPKELAPIELRIYYKILRLIITGQLAAGAKIIEETTCDVFGVSRTIVRKILLILNQEGLVDLPQNRGAFVHTPSLVEAEESVEVAELITKLIVRSLCVDRNALREEDVIRIEKHILYQEAMEETGNLPILRVLTGEFFVLLSLIYNNEIIFRSLTSDVAKLYLIGAHFQRFGVYQKRSDLLRKIFISISDGDLVQSLSNLDKYWDSVRIHIRLHNDVSPDDFRYLLTKPDD